MLLILWPPGPSGPAPNPVFPGEATIAGTGPDLATISPSGVQQSTFSAKGVQQSSFGKRTS